MPACQLVVFDCDGVLVDSERITNRVFCGMLNNLGIEVTLEDMFERFVGHSMDQCVELITGLLGAPPPNTFIPELHQRVAAALESEVEAVDGVEDALDAISLPCCVASSGEHEKIQLTLGKTGLLDRFEGKIFSVVDVGRPKPSPDVFLRAASTMGRRPEECIVVEDTPAGVIGGVSAGMYMLGFAANTPAHRLKKAGANEIFSRMADLPELISRHVECATP